LEDPLPLPLTSISELQTVSRGSGSIEHPLPEVPPEQAQKRGMYDNKTACQVK